jgi:hypothetical protein
MDRIPTTREGVWAYEVRWTHYNQPMRTRFRCVRMVCSCDPPVSSGLHGKFSLPMHFCCLQFRAEPRLGCCLAA